MSNETPPKRDSLASNPQVLAAVIGGLVTIVVAIIGIVPALVNSRPTPTPPPTIVIVTSTPEPTHTAEIISTQNATPTSSLPTAIIAAPVSNVEPTAIVMPTSLPALPLTDGNILLLYDEVSFTLRNQSEQMLSLEGVTFSSVSGQWEARDWGPSVYDKLPADKCLRLRDANVGQRQPPADCRDQIFGLQEVGQSALFWLGVDSFDVLRSGQVLATCQRADGSCLINI
jgi:hypothetical protein